MRVFFSLGLFLLNMLLTGCVDLAVNHGKNKQIDLKNIPHTKGQVYTMRGGLGGIFSRGMNRLEDNLINDYHIDASSTVWFRGNALEQKIIQNYENNTLRGPIVLAGHSLGANEQVWVAEALKRKHIPVALLITVDPVMPTKIPSNVEHSLNIYKPSCVPMLSGLRVKAVDSKRTRVENINIENLKGVNANHLTIDSNRVVQKLMVDQILISLHAKQTNEEHKKNKTNG